MGRTVPDGETLGRGEKLNRDREIPSAYVLFPVWLSSHGTYQKYKKKYKSTNQKKPRSLFTRPYDPDWKWLRKSQFSANISALFLGAENMDG